MNGLAINRGRLPLLLLCIVFAASSAFAQASQPPTLTSVSPYSGIAGTSFGASISGNNLANATSVTFSGGGVTATINPGQANDRLGVQIVIDASAPAGAKTLIVNTPGGIATLTFITYRQNSGPWSLTSKMLLDQRNPAVVTLIDGSPLALGGVLSNSCTGWNERYANGAWAIAGNVGRCESVATALADGRVLVTGGRSSTGGATTAAELTTPSTSAPITAATPIPPMRTARRYHTATLLPNGKVLVAGGQPSSGNEGLLSVEIFDPETLLWTDAAPMPEGRRNHVATLLPTGKVLMTGGTADGSASYRLGSLLYDYVLNSWTSTGPLPEGRVADKLLILADGQVALTGRQTVVYNVQSGSWVARGETKTGHTNGAFVTTANGSLLAVGGIDLTFPHNNAEIYDPGTGVWSLIDSMNQPKDGAFAALLDDSRILVSSGAFYAQGLATTGALSEVYDSGTTNPVPTLTSLSPSVITNVVENRSVLLTGSNFAANARVLINGTRVLTQYMGANQVMAFLPSSLLTPGDLQVSISNPGPGGGVSGGKVLPIASPNALPAITTVSPSSLARVPTSSVTLILTGSNFAGSSIVYLNGVAAPTTFVSSTRLTAVVPANAFAPGGPPLSVFNPGPGGGSATVPFIVVGRWKDTGAVVLGSTVGEGATLLGDGRVWLNDAGAIFDPTSNTWTRASFVSFNDYGFTATLLANGKVLVVGGAPNPLSGSSAAAKLYDPATDTFTQTGSMSVGRSYHTATLLTDGRVLVVGGSTYYSNSGALLSSEVYDPATGTWGTLKATNIPRVHHTATRLLDGTVIVTGGQQGPNDGYQGSVQSYDPATNSWSVLASMNSARSEHRATLLFDGRLLVTGGHVREVSGIIDLATAEIYDPRANRWASTAPMITARGNNTAVRLATGHVLVYGTDLFDPETETWLTTGSPLDGVGGVGLADGRAMKFGTVGGVTQIFEPASALPVWQPFRLPDLGAVSALSTATSTIVSVGYASVQPTGSSSTPAGLAIFGYRANGVLLTETGVPGVRPMQSGRVYAEISDAVNTGFAFANPGNAAATISFNFTNLAGSNFDSGSFVLPAGEKISVFLNQAPFNGSLSGKGTFTFGSSVPVAAAAFRGTTNERGDFLIATVPVIDLDAPSSTSTLVFPTFADGGGWITQVVLVNPGATVLTGTLQFFSQAGTVISSAAYSIPANASTTIQTSGLPASPVSGSVQAIPAAGTSAPQGFVIFGFSRNGVKVTEAGVTALPLSTAFRMYAESAPQPSWIQSGVAVANPWAAPTTVTLEVSQLDGSSTGLTGTLSLPAKGQITRFLSEIPGLETLPASFQGVVRVSSSIPISAMGLRGRYNERQDFLYTTTPPVDETTPPNFTPLYFPQVVNSGGYTTQFILFSGSAGQSSTGTTTIVGTNGERLNWQLR